MINSKLKIYYIYHSGFAVETPNYFLIFDYYKECNNSKQSDSFVFKDLLKNKKNVLIFSSHSHHDHFNPVILDWEKYNQNIKYILSSDITLENWENNYYKMSQGEDLFLKAESKPNTNNSYENKPDGIYIKAYGSTDIGVSFLVRVDGLNIFHAGDLNWWHWKEDSYEERKAAEENFKKEIDRIKGEPIDIVFFPVDPRLEEFYSLGAEYFIKEIEPKILIPMHFGDNLYITKEFTEKNPSTSIRLITISYCGEKLEI